jgi:hypothetical protein
LLGEDRASSATTSRSLGNFGSKRAADVEARRKAFTEGKQESMRERFKS